MKETSVSFGSQYKIITDLQVLGIEFCSATASSEIETVHPAGSSSNSKVNSSKELQEVPETDQSKGSLADSRTVKRTPGPGRG